MDFILGGLAIGNYKEAMTPSVDIDGLLCVAEEVEIANTDLLYHKVPIVDMQPIPKAQLKEAVEWIANNLNNHRIMVFCNAGIGRSSSVVVAYLCCALGYSFGQAVEHVATIRPYMSVLPNLLESIEGVMLGKEEPATRN